MNPHIQCLRSLHAVVALMTVISATAENWPAFRGPAGDGHSTEQKLPTEWSAEKNIAWRAVIPGLAWSSPAVVDGRVYLTTAVAVDAGGQTLRVLCLEAATGKQVWDTEAFAAPITQGHKKNSQASPTPIVEGERLYVHFGHLGTACLDLKGKVQWRNTELSYSPVHGNGGSPIIVDDLLIFSCDGQAKPFIAALDKRTGKLAWKVQRETAASKKFSFNTPTLIEVDGQKQIITCGSGAVSALEPKTGKELWRVRYGEGYSLIPKPVFGHGLLFIATGYDRPNVLAIRLGGKGDVTDTHIAWTLTKGAPHTPSLLLVGEELYMVSDAGIATCVDARTGQVHWSERLPGNYSASPLFAAGKIYFQNETGTGTVLKPGKKFEKLSENPLNERSLASYAVADSALFIRTDQHLYKVKAE
jgi:outer membrane protein assembly factor BamB